jgi:hypothetical protein
MVLQQPESSIPVPALESGARLTRAEFERRLVQIASRRICVN